jgi:hypothetical protein
MKPELLERVGIRPDLPAAERAAAVVRALPLRYESVVGRRDAASAVESGWLSGAAECIRVMSVLYQGDIGRGTAFGGPWPYMKSGGRLLAPALPVVLSDVEVEGPDGWYRLREGVVQRESAGRERPLLAITKTGPETGTAFDLLWFDDAARYLVRGGRIEIEDLFSVMRLPATASAMERLLIRARRVDPAVVGGLCLDAPTADPAEIEVHRLRELVVGESWRDPERLFAGKEGVVRAAVDRDQLTVEMEGGQEVVFNILEERDGWRAYVWQGRYPFRSLALSVSDRTVALTASLRPDLDPLTHSLRGRLAFELNGDLVALGSAESADHSR